MIQMIVRVVAKRARTIKGRYKGDDKSTFYNEAWVGGISPSWIKKKWKKFTKWYFKLWI